MANTILKEGIDYKGFTSELELLVKGMKKTVKGIKQNQGRMQTARDLTTTFVLLTELLKRTNTQLDKISANNNSLSSIQRRIDSMAIDKVFYQIPIQDVAKKNYYQRMSKTTKDLNIANTNLKNAIDSIQKLEIRGKVFKYNLESDIAYLKNARKILSERINKGASDPFESNQGYPSLKENFSYSFEKGALIFVFYTANQAGNLTVMFLFIVGLALYLRAIRSKYKKANLYQDLRYPVHVLNYPIASSILIMISIFQFFLPTPPFVFLAFLWFICGMALLIILRRSVVRYWFLIFVAFFILNNFAFQDNLFLLYSPGESRFILFMSLIGFALGIYIFKNIKKEGKEIYEKSFAIALIVFMVLEILAAFLILNGAYNLGKMFMTNGYFTILIAYQLIWAFGLSIDVLNFSKDLTQSEEEQALKAASEPKKFKAHWVYLCFICNCVVCFNQ